MTPTSHDRDTCLCKIRANVQFMADKLVYHRVIQGKNPDSLWRPYAVKSQQKNVNTESVTSAKEKLQTGEFDPGLQTYWCNWKNEVEEREKTNKGGTKHKFNVHLNTKERIYGTFQSFFEDFTTALKERFARHVFNIRHQYSTLSRLKENVGQSEIILQVDFAENYLCKYSSEIQAVHFGDSHKQASLHTGVAYIGKGISSVCSVSSPMRHDP